MGGYWLDHDRRQRWPLRFCGAALNVLVTDSACPPCQSYLTAEQLDDMEPFYPLHV